MPKHLARALGAGPGDDTFTCAYFFQYCSLMFILLTFVIGSFRLQDSVVSSGAASRQPAQTEPESKAAPAQSRIEIGGLSYARLFDDEGALESGEVEALAGFLRNHDVDAEITIPGGSAEPSFARAIGQATVISRFLVRQGVPTEAFKVTVTPDHEGGRADVRFFREAQR